MDDAKVEEKSMTTVSQNFLSASLFAEIFPPHLELVPQLNEVYELALAFYESRILSDEELIRNGAYFARVHDRLTRHFLMCRGEPVKVAQHSSSRLKSFFQTNQFKTGYATHGLFPYRGKFHPQMIKALLNTMGLKAGDKVLDPMMGSGTVLIEATLMGIESVGVDASPFCRFMTQAKLDGLQVPLDPIKNALADPRRVFDHFLKIAGTPIGKNAEKGQNGPDDLFSQARAIQDEKGKEVLPKGCEEPRVYNFLLLAFLDSAGYSERSDRRTPYEQFRAILERYAFVVEKIQNVLRGAEEDLAEATCLEGDARALSLDTGSIDGVIFSPPYSFAIDYLQNDLSHLKFMGVNVQELRNSMIGLRGKNMKEQFELYKEDMERVLSECARVLKRERICTILVGTNNNQLSRILRVPPEKVKGIDEILVEVGEKVGFRLLRRMERQITGMANTMRTEYILMLQHT